MSRRVVITGVGLVSPLGNTAEQLWENLSSGNSGVSEFTSLPPQALPTRYGAEARDFTGSIENFGPLEKTLARTIKKSLKMMCREIQMGVAVAQMAIADGKLALQSTNLDRIGVVYGSDYMLTLPHEFTAGIKSCLDGEGRFQFTQWAEKGLPLVEPLWLLKYLPNLPASHIAIFNDLRGPNNSLTMREASSNAALAEAYATIVRGHADLMIAGSTGTKVHPARSLHVVTQEEVATGDGAPERLSRPFDRDRQGLVMGEGAAALLIEELHSAQARGAKILGEILGFASSSVTDRRGNGQIGPAIRNVLARALRSASLTPEAVGHVHAHGLSTRKSDAEEARAIQEVFADRKTPVPVVAAKSYFGNLGAAGGMVELIGSLLAMQHDQLFATLNYETPDPECPVNVVKENGHPPGDVVVNVNVSPQGQASAVVVKRFR